MIHSHRNWVGSVAASLILVLLSAACSTPTLPASNTASPSIAAPLPAATQPSAPAPTATTVPVPQELVVGLSGLPTSLDPVQDNGLGSLATYSLLYDRLVDVDEKGALQPALAVSWKSINETTWEFKLKDGIKFHNGEAFDATAAKFVLDRMLTAKESKFTTALGSVKANVTVTDPLTLRVETSAPVTYLPSRFATRAWMFPPKYLEQVGVEKFASAPVGTGKFKVVEWLQDNRLVLAGNENYWRARPKVTKITLRHMPDQTSRVNSVEAKEIDVAYVVDPEQATRLEKAGFKIINQPVGQGYQLFFRTVLDSPVSKVKVRQALSHAVDVETISKALFGGMVRVLQGQPTGPDADGWDAGIKAYPFDLQKARSLLTEAGYPNGFPLQFDTTSGMAPKDKEVAELLADQFSKVGVKLEIILNERGVYLDKLNNAKMAPLWSISLNYAPAFDITAVLFNFTCAPNHKSNCDKQLDADYLKTTSVFDTAERNKLVSQQLRYINEQAPSIFLWQVPGLYVVNPRVEGIKLRGDYTMDLSAVTVTKR